MCFLHFVIFRPLNFLFQLFTLNIFRDIYFDFSTALTLSKMRLYVPRYLLVICQLVAYVFILH